MKKQIPILMSAMMVQAILAGRKTITRRLVKEELDDRGLRYENPKTGWEDWHGNPVKCRYGKPGDMLYVREEHYQMGIWVRNGLTKTGKQKWKFEATHPVVCFEHNKPALFEVSRNKAHPERVMWYKRLARFMPKDICRIWLEVTDIRVERLQDISEADAVAEGIEPVESLNSGAGISGKQMYKNYHKVGYTEMLPLDSFETLWISINGEENWDSNPWVWVVSFRALSTTGKPAELEKEAQCQ